MKENTLAITVLLYSPTRVEPISKIACTNKNSLNSIFTTAIRTVLFAFIAFKFYDTSNNFDKFNP